MSKLTSSPAWTALARHHQGVRDLHMRALFAQDPNRFRAFSLRASDLFIDYSKNRATQETLQLLFALARQARGEEARDRMVAGERINGTERPPAPHAAP